MKKNIKNTYTILYLKKKKEKEERNYSQSCSIIGTWRECLKLIVVFAQRTMMINLVKYNDSFGRVTTLIHECWWTLS